MATQYFLPCKCGKGLKVDLSQAGLQVPCACGLPLEVPTLRGLRQLEVVSGPVAPVAKKVWGPRQGMMFLGFTITALGLGMALFFWITRPVYETPMIDLAAYERIAQGMTLEESFKEWNDLSIGLDDRQVPALYEYQQLIEVHWRWGWAGLGLAGAGLLVAGIAWISGSKPP